MSAAFDADAAGADRLKRIPFSGIRRVFDAVARLEAQGRDVIHWQIGRTDFDTPEHIKRGAAESLARGDVHYAPSAGVPALRRGSAHRTEIDTGVEVNPDTQVIVMAGANEGILVSMLALVNPGDEVIVARPNWHHYKSCVALAGGAAVEVETKEENDFALRAGDIERALTPRTKLVCLTSPGNPTGCAIPESELAGIVALAAERGFMVLSDEIYARIYYGGAPCAPIVFS